MGVPPLSMDDVGKVLIRDPFNGTQYKMGVEDFKGGGMGIPSISSNVVVQSISYSSINSEMIYVFLVDGVKFEFSGRLHSDSGMQGLEYSDELEAFLMSLMPIDPRVSKKLNALSWSYVEGASVKFPVALVSS